jgi:hypothetical protein
MSSSNEYEIGTDDLTQELHEQQFVSRFDYPRQKIGPQIAVLVLCLLGFGIVIIIGIKLNKAWVGDLEVELSHNKFYTKV